MQAQWPIGLPIPVCKQKAIYYWDLCPVNESHTCQMYLFINKNCFTIFYMHYWFLSAIFLCCILTNWILCSYRHQINNYITIQCLRFSGQIMKSWYQRARFDNKNAEKYMSIMSTQLQMTVSENLIKNKLQWNVLCYCSTNIVLTQSYNEKKNTKKNLEKRGNKLIIYCNTKYKEAPRTI